MNKKDFSDIMILLKNFRDIETWTSEKHKYIENVLEIMQKGRHELFNSSYKIHGRYVGYFYLNNSNHQRRGTLKKFRGDNIMVLCYGRGIGASRNYIAATIDDESIFQEKIRKLKVGLQPNLKFGFR